MYTLIVFAFAGVMAHGDSVALATVPGFHSEQACNAAGQQAKALTVGTFKELRYVCVEVPSFEKR